MKEGGLSAVTKDEGLSPYRRRGPLRRIENEGLSAVSKTRRSHPRLGLKPQAVKYPPFQGGSPARPRKRRVEERGVIV